MIFVAPFIVNYVLNEIRVDYECCFVLQISTGVVFCSIEYYVVVLCSIELYRLVLEKYFAVQSSIGVILCSTE